MTVVAEAKLNQWAKELGEDEAFKDIALVDFILTDKQLVCTEKRPLIKLGQPREVQLRFHGSVWDSIGLSDFRISKTWPDGWNEEDFVAISTPPTFDFETTFTGDLATIKIEIVEPLSGEIPESTAFPNHYVIVKFDAYAKRLGDGWSCADPRVGVKRGG